MHQPSTILLVCLLLLLGACTSGGAGGPEIPAGWTTTTGAGFEISHPADWTVERDDVPGRIDLVGPDGQWDSRVIVSAADQRAPGVTAAELLRALVAELQVTAFDIIDLVRDSEVESWGPTNADDAARQRVSYDQRIGDDEQIPVTEWIGVALGAGVEVQVRAVDDADEFDDVESLLRQIMSTLFLTGT